MPEQRYRLNSARHCMKGSHAPIYSIPPLLCSVSVTITNFNSTPYCSTPNYASRDFMLPSPVSPWRPCMNVSPPPSALRAQQTTPALQPGHAKSTVTAAPLFHGPPPGPHRTAGQRLFSFRFHLHTLFCLSFSNRRPVRSFFALPILGLRTRLACILRLTLLAVNV